MQFKLSKRLGIVSLALLLIGFAALSLSPAPRTASADGFGRTEVTFTKYLTTFPNMAGVVGGDVGTGTYAGEILTYDPTLANGQITRITADYHLNGSLHQSTARVTVWQFGNSFALISGGVTSGWRQGGLVFGTYKVLSTCPENPAGPCYQGTLYIAGGAP